MSLRRTLNSPAEEVPDGVALVVGASAGQMPADSGEIVPVVPQALLQIARSSLGEADVGVNGLGHRLSFCVLPALATAIVA